MHKSLDMYVRIVVVCNYMFTMKYQMVIGIIQDLQPIWALYGCTDVYIRTSVALYRLYTFMYYGLSHILPLYRVHTYVYYDIVPLDRYHRCLVIIISTFEYIQRSSSSFI